MTSLSKLAVVGAGAIVGLVLADFIILPEVHDYNAEVVAEERVVCGIQIPFDQFHLIDEMAWKPEIKYWWERTPVKKDIWPLPRDTIIFGDITACYKDPE